MAYEHDMNGMDDDVNDLHEMADGLVTWLQPRFAQLKQADAATATAAAANGKLDPKAAMARSYVVKLQHNRGQESPGPVELYTYTEGDDVTGLARSIVQTAQNDALGFENGASYFVSIEGLPARRTLRFGAPMKPDAEAMTAARQQAMGQPGGGVWPPPRVGPGGMGAGGMGPGGPMGPGGYPEQNPALVFVNAMVEDKRIQLEHNKDLMRLAIGSHRDIMRMTTDITRAQHETIQTYERERIRNIQVYQELYDKKVEREIALNRQIKNEERKDKAFALVEPLALGAAARFFGAKGVPAQMAPLVTMLTSSFRTMDGARLEKLMTSGLLTPDEGAALMEALKVLVQIQEEAAASAQQQGAGAVVNGVSNGASSVTP